MIFCDGEGLGFWLYKVLRRQETVLRSDFVFLSFSGGFSFFSLRGVKPHRHIWFNSGLFCSINFFLTWVIASETDFIIKTCLFREQQNIKRCIRKDGGCHILKSAVISADFLKSFIYKGCFLNNCSRAVSLCRAASSWFFVPFTGRLCCVNTATESLINYARNMSGERCCTYTLYITETDTFSIIWPAATSSVWL